MAFALELRQSCYSWWLKELVKSTQRIREHGRSPDTVYTVRRLGVCVTGPLCWSEVSLTPALTTDEEESVVSVWERQRGQQDNFSFFLRPLLTRFLNHDAFVREIGLTAGQSREIQTQRKGLWWMWWMAAAVLTVSTFWSSYVWLFHNQNAASLSYATRLLSFI